MEADQKADLSVKTSEGTKKKAPRASDYLC